MKTALISAVSAFALASSVEQDLLQSFEDYLVAFNKTYSAEEKAHRLAIYSKSLDEIASLRELNPELTFDVNQFSDMTEEEKESIMTSDFDDSFLQANYKSGIQVTFESSIPGEKYDPEIHTDVLGATSANNAKCTSLPVRSQKQCGSCWAHAVGVVAETAYCKATGILRSVAPQYMVDCFSKQLGCRGGYGIHNPLTESLDRGFCGEADYRYRAVQGTCNKSACSASRAVGIDTPVSLQPRNEVDMMRSIDQYGAVGILWSHKSFARFFSSYKGGNASRELCERNRVANTGVDHAIAAVGYKYDAATKKTFFKIKNSYDTTWGEQGFMWLEFGACGWDTQYNAAAVVKNPSAVNAKLQRIFNGSRFDSENAVAEEIFDEERM